MVYVLNKDGQPLMPTDRHGKVKHLLKTGRAKVLKRCPFTIQLTYETTAYKQQVTLGVDAGSKTIGLSASTETQELYSSEVMLRTDLVDLLSTRRESRHSRRNRKTRYREPRFLNRVQSKHKEMLAPSIEQKIQTHLAVVEKICQIIPITDIVVEGAAFDTQLLKARELGLPLPEGCDYQQGEQLYFWNVREYVLFRDHHTCRCCQGKSKDKVLEIHHIQSRKTGGDAPNNLITLCKACHEGYHKGEVVLPETIQRGNRYNDAVFMGIMRWTFFNRLKLKEKHANVSMTFGYITKNTRIKNGLPKAHRIDALCIGGHPKAAPAREWFLQKKVRCHNRQIHKLNPVSGGARKRNQAPYLVKGFRLFDKVFYKRQECFITGRRQSGYFLLRMLDGTKVHASAKVKDLRLAESRKYYLTERRCAG